MYLKKYLHVQINPIAFLKRIFQSLHTRNAQLRGPLP